MTLFRPPTYPSAPGGRKMPLLALICLIQCSNNHREAGTCVKHCDLLFFFTSLLSSTSFIFGGPQTASPSTPKGRCCPQTLGVGDTFHCGSVSGHDSRLACWSCPFLVPGVKGGWLQGGRMLGPASSEDPASRGSLSLLAKRGCPLLSFLP